MRRSTLCFTLSFTLMLLVFATMASAGTFTITLNNGTSFLTRYEPEEVEWDSSLVRFPTDRGNWIAISRDDIAEITSSVEESGFGYQLNTTTIFLGWSPNDLTDEGEEGEGGEGGTEAVNENLPDPNPPAFTLQQFVNPGDLVGSQPVDR